MSALRRLARAVALAETDAELRRAQEQARRLVGEDDARKARVRVKSAPRLKAVRATKAQRQENWATTKAEVMLRADGLCELCNRWAGGLDAHHLAPGPLRRQYEAPNAVVAACRSCHDRWHANDVDVLWDSLAVAKSIDAPDIVRAALKRRIDKVTP